VADSPTQADVVRAAQSLDQPEFTRDDLAAKLGAKKSDFKEGFKAARQAGQLEKVRDDDDGAGVFRLAG
jgi:hypothetical protein